MVCRYLLAQVHGPRQTQVGIRPANTPSWPRRQRRWCPPDL